MGNNVIDQARHRCSGCGLCVHVCPSACLEMVADPEGFLFPEINREACIDCGICLRRCPMLKADSLLKDERNDAYAAVLKNTNQLKESSSGGVFTALANHTLSMDGVVYGAVMGKDLKVYHKAARKEEDLVSMRGSKYVQSDINEVFQQIKEALLNKTEVLFTGTPCQVAAVAEWAKGYESTLTTVDLVCHGVPSPGLFRQHTKWLEGKYGAPVKELHFRSKAMGYWGLYKERIIIEDREIHQLAVSDPYYAAFLRCETFREACYQCPFSCEKRVSDLTICDYWGVEVEHSELNASRGISGVIINTEKGKMFFEASSHELKVYLSTKKQISKHQKNLNAPSVRSSVRDEVYHLITEEGYAVWASRYLKSATRMINVLRSSMPRRIKILRKRLQRVLKG